MTTITLRNTKGTPLTNTELDANFTNLNTDKAELTSPVFINSASSRKFLVNAEGTPSSNLGNPSIAEMALFDPQFNNKTEFYDIANMFVETSTDGTTWSTYSVTDTQKRILIGGDGTSSIAIPYNTAYFRIRFRANGYVYLDALYAYFSSNGHTTKVHIYKKHDSGTYTQHTSSNTAVSSWPGHLYLPFSTIPFHPAGTLGSHYHEVSVVFIPVWNATYPANTISLSKIQIWGGYPAGKRNLYYTDELGNATFPANIQLNAGLLQFNNSGVRSWNAGVDGANLNTYSGDGLGDVTFNNNIALHAGNYNSYSPTLTGTGASGTWGISVTGNAATATTFSTTRADWNGVTNNAVAGQLGWKNYGNNHTIFDASNSTSPTGTAVSNTNPEQPWEATYPTLMGWNGTNTYGVRVDSAKIADNVVGGTVAATTGTFTGLLKAAAGFQETEIDLVADDIDVALANYFSKTITATTTFTVSNTPASGTGTTFILDLTNGGAFAVTWWAGVKWDAGSAPTLTAAGRDVLAFFTHNGGVTWTGLVVAKDSK